MVAPELSLRGVSMVYMGRRDPGDTGPRARVHDALSVLHRRSTREARATALFHVKQRWSIASVPPRRLWSARMCREPGPRAPVR